jgi:hypothetical protein
MQLMTMLAVNSAFQKGDALRSAGFEEFDAK